MAKITIITDDNDRVAAAYVSNENNSFFRSESQVIETADLRDVLNTMLEYCLILKNNFAIVYYEEKDWKEINWSYIDKFGPVGVDPYVVETLQAPKPSEEEIPF